MKRVTIMRGIPGSGKSTLARDIDPKALIVSADHYHMVDGVYQFKKENASAAHNDCLKKFITATLTPEVQHIIVDNTNVKVFEIAPYYRLAETMGFEVQIIWILCPPVVGVERTKHGVPLETIAAMANGFEPLPPWWNLKILTWRG